MSRKTRVAKIEENLKPLEAVIRWMHEAHSYPSLLSYYEWLRTQPNEESPLIKLPRQVAVSLEATLRRLPEAERNARLRVPQKEVLFLIGIHDEANALLWKEDQALQYRLVWIIERLRGLTLRAFRQEEEGRAAFRLRDEAGGESSAERVAREQEEASLRQEFELLLSDLRDLRGELQAKAEAIDLVSRRYLDGEDPLFPCYRDRLESTTAGLGRLETIGLETLELASISPEESFAFYLTQVAAGVRRQEQHARPDPPEVPPVVLEVGAEARRTARRLVLEARRRMFDMAGETETGETGRGGAA